MSRDIEITHFYDHKNVILSKNPFVSTLLATFGTSPQILKWKKTKSGFLNILPIFDNKHFESYIHFNREGNRR